MNGAESNEAGYADPDLNASIKMNLFKKLRSLFSLTSKPQSLQQSEVSTAQTVELATLPGYTPKQHLQVGRSSPLPQPKPEDSVIGQDAVMTGCLTMNGRLIVQGKFSGVIQQGARGGNLYIDEEAVVRGNLSASNALIYGAVEGAVTATLLSIEKTANVRGQVEYKDIRLKGGISSLQLRRNEDLKLLTEDQVTRQQIAKG